MGALAAALAVSFAVSSPADARRGGSFGSRGSRTYHAPRPTSTSPGYTGPVQRSMTPYTPGSQYGGGYRAGAPNYMPGGAYGGYGYPRRPGFGTGLAAGLIGGGLLGAMMGHGWGGGWGGGWGMGAGGLGLFSTLFQLLILGLVVSFVVSLFRRRRYAPAAGFAEPFASPFQASPQPGAGPQTPWGGQAYPSPAGEIAVSSADRAAFERMLADVQAAFGRQDYGALRQLCTPEVMGYLAEELSDNATHGRRNEVSAVRLLQSDVSEAWAEGDADYVTMALRYESIDVMRDRQTGQVLSGDPNRPTPTNELWTFVRHAGGAWKLSAIQET
jgi:predicted lipid-binding transport protein (Tim44 family)